MEKEIQEADAGDKRRILVRSIVRMLFYSLTAGVIYFVCTLFWWLGLILFVVFAFYILVEILISGSILVIGALVLRLFFPMLTNYRVLNSDKFGDLQKSFGALAVGTGILVVTQCYYVFLTFMLGYFIFSRA
jgi:hypothetical protein